MFTYHQVLICIHIAKWIRNGIPNEIIRNYLKNRKWDKTEIESMMFLASMIKNEIEIHF